MHQHRCSGKVGVGVQPSSAGGIGDYTLETRSERKPMGTRLCKFSWTKNSPPQFVAQGLGAWTFSQPYVSRLGHASSSFTFQNGTELTAKSRLEHNRTGWLCQCWRRGRMDHSSQIFLQRKTSKCFQQRWRCPSLHHALGLFRFLAHHPPAFRKEGTKSYRPRVCQMLLLQLQLQPRLWLLSRMSR